MSSLAAAYHAVRARGGVIDLSCRVKLALTGADRVRYLQGQVTSNVQKLAPSTTQPACVTTAKGRLCAEVMITAAAEALLIDAEESLRETLPPRLERYIIADDVAVTELDPEKRLLHFLDTKPDWLGDSPVHAATRFGRPGWDWWPDAATVEKLWPEITQRVEVIGEALAEVLRIEAGVPRWGRELDETTLPPEAGLDRTHIDYHKGCYVGQEVISRLKSVGHVNRQLVGFLSPSGVPLATGWEIVAADGDARLLGVLTSAAHSFALEKPIALGYLKRGSPTGALLARPAGAMGVVVTVCELPFHS